METNEAKQTPGPYSYNWNAVSKQWRIIGADGYGAIGAIFNKANAVAICAALNERAKAPA